MNIFKRIFGQNEPPYDEVPPYEVDRATDYIRESDLETLSFQELYRAWQWYYIRSYHMKVWTKGKSDKDRRALCVASLHRNGYTREAAIKGLMRFRHPETLPFVLWALRDWVPQVRAAAEAALETLLIPELAGAFLKHHRMLDQLDLVRRINIDNILSRVRQYLVDGEAKQAVLEAARAGSPRVRLFAYRLLNEDLRGNVGLQAQVANDPEPHIRRWFVGQLERYEAVVRRAWLERFMLDRSSLVACQVIRSLCPELRSGLRDKLVDASCSDSRPVREAARVAVEGMQRGDFAGLYKARICKAQAGSVMPGWLAGLGETGGSDDAHILSPFFTSDKAKVRAEALRAIATLDREGATPHLLRAFSDTSGRVRRVVINVMCKALVDGETDSLYRFVSDSGDERVVLSSLRVLVRRGSWDAVAAILFGASREMDLIRHMSWGYGVTWIRTYGSAGWLKPTAVVLPVLIEAHRRLQLSGQTPPSSDQSAWKELADWVDRVCVV